MQIHGWTEWTTETPAISVRKIIMKISQFIFVFKQMEQIGDFYLRFVVVASTSNKKPLSFSCDIHELQPIIACFDMEIK